MTIRLSPSMRRVAAYLVFGVLTTGVNVAVYAGLTKLAGFGYLWANVVAWVASVLFAYATNRRWVFESSSAGPRQVTAELAAFVSTRVATGLLDTGLMYLLVGVAHAPDVYSKVVVNVIVVVLNYLLSRSLVFKDRGV